RAARAIGAGLALIQAEEDVVLVVGIHGDDDERPGDAGRMVGGTPLRGARTVRTIITSGARR
ncbi:hypothetical protein DN553_30955, partial [Burkholderia multivorans]